MSDTTNPFTPAKADDEHKLQLQQLPTQPIALINTFNS